LITIVGAGLAGNLLALELADRGQAVTLIAPENGSIPSATALSYGLLPPGHPGPWRRLQRRHGDLGLQRQWLQLGDGAIPLPAWQVNPGRFAAGAAEALADAGVRQLRQRVPDQASLASALAQGPVVLACGAGCRALAPGLDARLRVSWAGILELERSWARRLLGWRQGIAQLPERFARQELERRANQLQRDEWVVDAGLVPSGDRLIAGQISLIRPDPRPGDPPDPGVMEQQLRRALAARWPLLAEAPGNYRQAAVSFSTDGQPLSGMLVPGLWVLSGFSGAFAQLPQAATSLAAKIAASSSSPG